ncbi:interleukin-1 family member A [Periophthalmus magnuspinnatus]|uniref:interleukin-1 family member A n=1 Tax=Periophthalmus magnuspinnatus TaxID=409849 RepID=UPI00145AE236|nr:interleukin-1 family member A [Periophthalmus magnuspinnatus]
MEDLPVGGGVFIVHQETEGKHQYEVKSVIKNRTKPQEKFFLRTGDRLMMVNNTEIQDVPPEQLAEILTQGSPMLTVHKTIRKKEPVEEKPSDGDVLVPCSKEKRLLWFNQEMRRKDDQEQNEVLPKGEGEEEVCTEEAEESDLLVVSMKNTTISVMTGRSCDSTEPCPECSHKECLYDDVVMVAESSSITRVPGGSGSFRHQKCNEVKVENVTSRLFLNSLCHEKQVYMSPHPDLITIYYYKSDRYGPSSEVKLRGMPVVLNFSGSNCFLKCSQDEENRVQLCVEICEKQKLKNISRRDRQALAFVFYMKSERTGETTFESALHTGWFIQNSDVNSVEMATMEIDERQKRQFIIIIKK